MWKRQDLRQAFRTDRQLQRFMLTDVTFTGRVLGTGSYGSVEEVSQQSNKVDCVTPIGLISTSSATTSGVGRQSR